MNTLPRKLALGAVSAALLTACAVETGEVVVAVTCTAEDCAAPGELHARVEDCDEDTAWYGDQAQPLAGFGSGQTLVFGFENVLDGTRCAQAFYDLDEDGAPTAGDIVSSDAIDAGVDEESDDPDQELDDDAEIEVEVEDDVSTQVDIELDTVMPVQIDDED
jgi:hypothetical protein